MPFTYNARQPFTYNARQPGTYNNRQPFTYNHREPYTVNARQPFTYNARTGVNVQSVGQQPSIYSFRNPFNFPGGGGGCFAPGSLIWLADGSHSPIEDCVLGQYVMTWNESTKLLEPREISLIMQPRMCPIFDVTFSDGRVLQMTDTHPLMLPNGQWGALDVEKSVREHEWMQDIETHEIAIGDSIFSMLDGIMFDRQDEMGLEIVSVEEHSEMEVHNLSGVQDNNNFFVNGMLAHNFGNQFQSPQVKN